MNEPKVTDEQIIEALKTMSRPEAAAHLGIHLRTLAKRKARMVRKGWSPEHDMTHIVPDGFRLKGTSSLYKDGVKAPVLQWVKTTTDEERQREIMEAAIAAMGEDLPRMSFTPAPSACNADLLNCYVITDYHLGLLSWHEETGADYDLSIAEHQLVAWFAEAIRMAPDAEIGVFAQLGDYLHWDGLDAVTPASKHLLDADTRFQKLVRVAIRVTRRVVDMLLTKHQRVHVLMAEGNHDTASSIWLREWFSAIYENEPRITVDRSPDPYYCVEHGQTSLFFHHGHKKKPTAVADVFVAKFRDVFGRTKHSYAHLGHLHHVDVKENNLMIVEQHRTLAAPDAYASRGGWISGRDAKVITYHKAYGEVGRLTINSDMLKAGAA
ncbi:winged helix-turn-helix domain-containing protein [Pseudomonas sp. RC4D1]|uniref:winged helix-turn-helix domain-containing protein n=1 Tax=Pseudomonas sp. RC4D1 TaxID=2834407 RepID=UPI001BCE7267|nr:winged helix-turn-helix domain-containing protein [Pseudomonas sp. RC4D1]MBS7559944.1 winged helix-turn-helix domain-containing protein [Pseudomonas sp. RC4D1]